MIIILTNMIWPALHVLNITSISCTVPIFVIFNTKELYIIFLMIYPNTTE
jgi:hypothetical protein